MIGQRIFSGFPNEEAVGYARAAVVDDWVFVSGTTGFDPETRTFPPDVETQCENCFHNIERALEEAGASLDELVRVLIFVARETDFEKVAQDHSQTLLRGTADQHSGLRPHGVS